MANKSNRARKYKSEISRTQQNRGATRKIPTREMRAATKVQAKVTPPGAVKAAPKSDSQQKSAGANRSDGIRLFNIAGRPTKEQFILVYGERGPRTTWEQRATAGVPAEKFQAALAKKAVSHPAAPKPAHTTTRNATSSVSGA